MSLEAKLSLRQVQKMVMTPMLQEAINLLQLSKLDLVQTLRRELEENPVLEEVMDEGDEEKGTEEIELGKEDSKEPASDFDWETYFEDTSDYYPRPPREEVERPDLERYLTKPLTLPDHLLFQLRLSTSDEELLRLGALIIGNLDENGYLMGSLGGLAEQAKASLEAMERALRFVQSFDPAGVAARDLKECLLLQLEADEEEAILARRLLSEHFSELDRGRLEELAEMVGVSVRELQGAFELIASLEPKPGRAFNAEASQYIVPDVYIVKVDDRFVVMLDEEGLPRLRISPYYRTLLAKKAACPHEVREYVERRLRSALWLIKSIEQRQQTLRKVAESLVKFQREFLESGISALCPLTLREVAQDIGMHESTVSRVTTNKYIQTPQGLFEMKYFFHRGVPRSDGQSVSSLKVKDLVRRYFASEDRGKPLSDEKIVELLQKEHGIEIARRTVAKYRSQLKIPSSSRRKHRQVMGG